MGAEQGKPLVLVVDDEYAVRTATSRILQSNGFNVEECDNGIPALQRIKQGGVGAVITDIWMPGMDGMALLKEARKVDLDLPIVLMTAAPTVQSAIDALDLGAARYLTKPYSFDDLVAAVKQAMQIGLMSKTRRELAETMGNGSVPSDLAGLSASLDRALAQMWMAYQPIVRAADQQVIAYEALMRTREPSLPNPMAILEAAERLGRLKDIMARTCGLVGETMPNVPPTTRMFINIHPENFVPAQLERIDAMLGEWATDIVFEVTERSSMPKPEDVHRSVVFLRERGYGIALDDLGAGYASLNSFTLLEPDVVKLDRALVSMVDKSKPRRNVIGTMITLCHDMGMQVVAEGVERVEERDVVQELGCDYQQGYLFAKPAPPFVEPTWP